MGKKILVAESDNTVQQVVSYFLNLEGFEVMTAGDGIAALEAVERASPEVILLDPALAGINGIEVCRLIGEKPRFKNIPILFLADPDRSGDIPSGFGIINKPVDPTKMVDTIKEYIEKGQPSAVVQGEPAELGESVSIEELLGWEVSEEASKKEEVVLQEGAGEFTDISAGLFRAEEPEVTPTPESPLSPLLQRGEYQGEGPEAEAISQGSEMAQPSAGVGETTAEAVKREASGSVEEVKADLRGRITDEMIKNIISRIAEEITERVVWDVVPKIAEEEIKKEIERLKGDSG